MTKYPMKWKSIYIAAIFLACFGIHKIVFDTYIKEINLKQDEKLNH